MIAPGSDEAHENEWLNSLTFLPENAVQPVHPVPLAFSVIAPNSTDSREATLHMDVYQCIHGHANEILVRETARSRELRRCTGCSKPKGYRKPIANSTKSRATEKLGRVFVYLSALRVLIRCLVRNT